jgi:hypothetical protein
LASVFFLTGNFSEITYQIKTFQGIALQRICRCHLFVKDMLAQIQEIAVFVKDELAQKTKI